MPVNRVARSLMILVAASVTVVPGFAHSARNRYALILQDEPVASRFTTRERMHSAAADGYRGQLAQRQKAVRQELNRRGVPIIGSVAEVLNAVFVSAPPERVAELAAIPGVLGVRPVPQMHMALNKATQLMNAPAAWNLVGGQSKAGAGIKIGILDTGSVTFSGMAPKAWLGSYKIWGSPYVNGSPGDVWINAVEDAVKDGMDVINVSAAGWALTGPLDTGAACGAPADTHG